MLRFDQICQILKISRIFILKLIHYGRIKSYNIGRLRRWVVKNILEYLIMREDDGRTLKSTEDSGTIRVRS